MKKWLIAAALVVAGLTGTANAQAPVQVQGSGSCASGDCASGGAGYNYGAHGHFRHTGAYLTHPKFAGFGGNVARMPTLPVYMAAPWYLYWPYDGHFQTVAPMAYGAFYAPPAYTGNPYLPVQYPGYVPGAPIPQFPMAPVRR